MNLSAADTGGGLLLVPQFTLAADTAKGLRPGFSRARQTPRWRSACSHIWQSAPKSAFRAPNPGISAPICGCR